MPKKLSIGFLLLFAVFVLIRCNSTREYIEYNYSPLSGSIESVTVNASLVGGYEDISGSKKVTIRKNPYYLRIALKDPNAEYLSAKITSVNLKSHKGNRHLKLSAEPTLKQFVPSYKADGNFAGFVVDNIQLEEDDYEIALGVEVCGETNCEQKEIKGTLKLELIKYKSNDIIDMILSQ